MSPDQIKKMQEGRVRANTKRKSMLSRSKAIKAKCLECTNFLADGRTDCGITTCPLYEWMPYRKSKPVLWWVKSKVKDWQYLYKRAVGTLEES